VFFGEPGKKLLGALPNPVPAQVGMHDDGVIAMRRL